MIQARTFILAHAEARSRAASLILHDAPDGWRVTVKPPGKNREQEERYHAMIGDIARQWEFMGQKWHPDDMKRILVDAFSEAMRQAGTPLHHDGRIIPSIDGRRVVQLGIQTSQFYKAEASNFIEYLFSFGAEVGIRWSDPTLKMERETA
jgi:NinB protein